MAEILGMEYDGIPYGPGPGAINGIDAQRIQDQLHSVLVSPAGLAYFASIGNRFNEGNRGTTYDHDPETGETVNSMGLPGIGIEAATPIIKEFSQRYRDAGKLLIVGVSTLRGDDALEVLPELVERTFEAGAPVVEVNYSCPNIVIAGGGRKPLLGYDLDAMLAARGAIVGRVGTSARVQEKLPPYIGEYVAMMPAVAASYEPEQRLGNVGVSGFNTIIGTERMRDGKPVLRVIADVDGEEVITHAGGLSGPAVAGTYYDLQAEFLSFLPENVPFFAAGGIWSGENIHERMNDPRVVATMGVSRVMQGEKAGRSYGATMRNIAMEYSEAI